MCDTKQGLHLNFVTRSLHLYTRLTQSHTHNQKSSTQLRDLNNKSWKILILDDANNSLEELMETLVFLESLEALIIPVVLEAPYRYVINQRLEEDRED